MITRLTSGVNAFVKRVFPERQIYHRAEGQVQYISLSTQTQLLAATASAVVMGWTAYATANVFLRGHMLDAQSAESSRMKNKYERWLAEARAREASALALLQSRTTDFNTQARSFEERHVQLLNLVAGAMGDGVVPGRSVRVASAADVAGDTVVMAAAAEDAAPRVSRVSLAAVAPPPGADRLEQLLAEQEHMLNVAEAALQERGENYRAILRLTDLNPNDILGEGLQGSGGPLVEAETAAFESAMSLEDPFAQRVARVAARVAEVERLERAIDAAPFGVPVGDPRAYVTSGFGNRIDPFTGRPALHQGLDFGAYRLAPITAVAPGVVTFAGTRGSYGKMVEIDHGHGFVTRYGHMHRLDVERGDEIAIGQKIGGMGSTGRSTGTHLHYEVWFRGRAYDPAKFLKAGRYVQQG